MHGGEGGTPTASPLDPRDVPERALRVTEIGGRGRAICLVTADVSGDQNGGSLAAAIREQAPDARLVGAGGSAMQRAGVDVQVQTVDLGYMGFLEIFRVARPVITQFRRCQDLVRRTRPDLVVLIDNETATLPFAMWLRRRHVPVAYFFPPHVWLWGRWRLPAIVPFARRFISAFREEADLYRAAGADGVWVGHPLRETLPLEEDRAALRIIGLDPTRPLVVLMPGSRRSEIRMLMLPILGAARRLQERDPTLQFAVPLANESLHDEIEQRYATAVSRLRDVAIYHDESYAVLSCARVVIQCSGSCHARSGAPRYSRSDRLSVSYD